MQIILNLPAIDAQIAHWKKQHERATNPVDQAVASGNINALMMVRVIHGLPMEPTA